MFFDTHTHLNDSQFETDRDAVLAACQAGGISRIVEIADSPADWDRAIALSQNHSSWISCSLGIHPYYSDQWSDRVGESLTKKKGIPGFVAIGEIGLDYVKSPIPPAIQQETFKQALSVAREIDLPVVLHCRGAYPDMLNILDGFYASSPKLKKYHGVLHCFSGTKEEALSASRLGFALGVDGPVTYPKNDALREALTAAGIDQLVLETDSPYLPPQSSRGRRNDPRAIPEIAGQVAKLFGITPEETARRTTKNGEELFRL